MIVFSKHLCGRQSNTEPHDEPDTEPCCPSLARDAVPGVLHPWELGRAARSPWECKPDMKFAHPKYRSLLIRYLKWNRVRQ